MGQSPAVVGAHVAEQVSSQFEETGRKHPEPQTDSKNGTSLSYVDVYYVYIYIYIHIHILCIYIIYILCIYIHTYSHCMYIYIYIMYIYIYTYNHVYIISMHCTKYGTYTTNTYIDILKTPNWPSKFGSYRNHTKLWIIEHYSSKGLEISWWFQYQQKRKNWLGQNGISMNFLHTCELKISPGSMSALFKGESSASKMVTP